ncbi:alanine--tRNA ligase [Leptospira sp. GIMC2001]|uniref:alanine--tRNA ligase n=1 Tax=Leptospira sp. GIMC2001 TaxID=1513297 RepID=UPI002349DA8A|nr:alanine--tRNA ligase [Leptospira sp. GIMC2001]WCL50614.1 alanine--tRNA ligase [Leptospira sp. GIMC2001]
MNPKSVSEIRELYLNYFKNQAHTIVPSASLIPSGDPTLLFTTAGMVQFKPYFTGAVELPFTRATSAQKCLRTTDLENVGQTERHCTFFEMLGNFSFGDYFKKEAIHYALDFSINHLGIPKDKIWITIFLDDDEARELWIQEGIPDERITRLGKKDNFWGPAGDSGACGPCSELYFDRGADKGFAGCGNKESCKPGCDCDRFMEYWNIVFNQFNQTIEGELLPLNQTGIDTGAGVERIALLLQEVDSVYDTDEFKEILNKISELSGSEYNAQNKVAFRVIADHLRSTFFAIGDSIYPDRTGRGYVIRRLIRRAALFARKIGVREAFLYKLIPELSKVYGGRYPDLISRKSEIEKVLKSEEELFLHTLELGLDELESILDRLGSTGSKILPGFDAFRLYGTFGFPREMTKELTIERGFEFDDNGFEAELEKDRSLSRDSWKGKKSAFLTGLSVDEAPATEFLGYGDRVASATIKLCLTGDGKKVDRIQVGEKAVLILDKTSFYAESGGQIADNGFIKSDNSLFRVTDVQKENDTFLHIGTLLKGELQQGQTVTTEIDDSRRNLLAYHHSGTHLMHGALRSILGDHVRQKASLVSDEYLRFDFSHPTPLTDEEISQVEDYVNSSIEKKISVSTNVLPIEEAKKSGAVAFFEEKYGDFVRIIEMGDRSIEFCGGTHVQNTGEILYFSILKESSPGAGNRRIEAVCGPAVVSYYTEIFQNLSESVQAYNLKAKEIYADPSTELITIHVPSPEEVEKAFQSKGSKVVSEYRALKNLLGKELEEKGNRAYKEKKKKEATDFQNNPEILRSLLEKKEIVKGIALISEIFDDVDAKSLKELGDVIKSNEPDAVLLFGSKSQDSATLVFMCNQSSVAKGVHCGNLLKSSVTLLGGKGGGKPDMAQGGGKEISKLADAISQARKELEANLS